MFKAEKKVQAPPLVPRLLWTALLMACFALAWRFVAQASQADHRTEAVVVCVLAFIYMASMTYRGRLGAHPLKSPGPWIVLLLLGGLPLSFAHRVEPPTFDTVKSEKSWLDKPFTIHGVHPGMTRYEVRMKLGPPTGHKYVYQTEPEHLNARVTEQLLRKIVSELKSDKASYWLYQDQENGLRDLSKQLTERLENHSGEFGLGEKIYASEGQLTDILGPKPLLVLWPEEESYDELEKKLAADLEQSDQEHHSVLILWSATNPPYIGSKWVYSTLLKTSRWKLDTFEQAGVAVDYVPPEDPSASDRPVPERDVDKVDSVHGDTLSYGGKVLLKAGEEYRGLPPDWPAMRKSYLQLFNVHPSLLFEPCVLLDLYVSKNLIQVQLVEGKVWKVAIYNLRYNK